MRERSRVQVLAEGSRSVLGGMGSHVVGRILQGIQEEPLILQEVPVLPGRFGGELTLPCIESGAKQPSLRGPSSS